MEAAEKTMCASVISLEDGQLIELILAAKQRLFFVGPGVSRSVAAAISQTWEELGRDAVQVVLDVDPEICRLGYGNIDGIRLLQETASRLGGTIYNRPGIRIGLLISDGTSLIFSPTPLLGYGTVLLRSKKTDFEIAVTA